MSFNSIKLPCMLVIILLSFSGGIYGQTPVTVSIFNEATNIPFTKFINTPLHPGIQLGTEFEWKEGKHFRLYPAINVGYMFHRNLFQGLYVNAELGFDFKTSFGLNLKSKIGLGYLHTFTTTQEYQLDGGAYESKSDRGNSRLMPSFTLGAGYNIHKDDPYSPEVFVLYQSWIEYPYSPGFIPMMSHTNLQIGTKFYTHKNKKGK